MPFLRFSRDKRGYEHVYLVHASHGRGHSSPARVLYWYRTPPGVKVGREPFDEAARRALEAEYPNLEFDWKRIVNTPFPPPETENWRERRRVQREMRQARSENARELPPAEASVSHGDASNGDPSNGDVSAAEPSRAAASDDAPQATDAVRSAATERTGDDRRRRRRRGGRHRGKHSPDPAGIVAVTDTPRAATPDRVVSDTATPPSNGEDPTSGGAAGDPLSSQEQE